ncbi:MAG: hypothetical protein ACPIOQ_65220, partial [Promethearchaeia archaeon]
MMGRLTKRMSSLCMVKAWERWVWVVTQKQKLKRVLTKSVVKLVNARLAMAIETWRETVQDEARRKRVMARVRAKISQRALSGAYLRWQEVAAKSKGDRAEDERRGRVVSKIVTRRKRQSLVAALGAWHCNGAQLRALASKSRRVLARWSNQAGISCLMAWREFTTGQGRRRALMKRLLGRIVQRSQSSAYLRWQAAVAEWQDDRAADERRGRLLSKIVTRLKNRSVASAFEVWRMLTQAEDRKRKIMGRILVRMEARGAAVAMQLWKAAVEVMRSEQDEEARQQRVMQKLILRMQEGAVFRAFGTWRENAGEIRHLTMKVARAVKRWGMQSAWTCLVAWNEHAAEECRRREVIRGIVWRMRQRCVVAALSVWRDNAAGCADERMDEC